MRILWFTNTPSLYKNNLNGLNGGGWIESLQERMSYYPDIELGVSFFHSDNCFKAKENNTTYYPIGLYNSIYKKIKHNIFYESADKNEIKEYLKIIKDFNPDIIHIFGSEKSFGLICNLINIPVIIHIQGLLNPLLNAYFPPGISKLGMSVKLISSPIKLIQFLLDYRFFTYNAEREKIILQQCNLFMGRTKWDEELSALFSPNRKYFFCNELLRKNFYNKSQWFPNRENKIIITSTLSKVFYKGLDIILKTAKILKDYYKLNIEWNVYGITECKELINVTGLSFNGLNVNLKGIINSNDLVVELQKSYMYIHPSYMDNSPNSICEAQILGLPVIATNVGGVSSLIENEISGLLVPVNDPYLLAVKINELANDVEKAINIGNSGRIAALSRHDSEKILQTLLHTYNHLQHEFK